MIDVDELAIASGLPRVNTLRTRLFWGLHVRGDFMIECDHCGERVEEIDELRGSGPDGLFILRVALEGMGWRSDDETDWDLCPSCVAKTPPANPTPGTVVDDAD